MTGCALVASPKAGTRRIITRSPAGGCLDASGLTLSHSSPHLSGRAAGTQRFGLDGDRARFRGAEVMGASGDDVQVSAVPRCRPSLHGEEVAPVGFPADGLCRVDLATKTARPDVPLLAHLAECAQIRAGNGDCHGFVAATRGSTAPGPGAARTSVASRRSPHTEHTKTALEMWPQALWVTWRGGPLGAA